MALSNKLECFYTRGSSGAENTGTERDVVSDDFKEVAQFNHKDTGSDRGPL